MLITLMIFGCLIALGAAVIQWIKEKKSGEKHHTFTLIFAFIGTFITTVTSIMQSVDSSKSEENLTKQHTITMKNLKQQIDFLKNTEYSNFLSSFNEYQVLKGEYFNVSYYIYKSSFRKEEFLQLKRNQIEQIEENINQAIRNIRKNKYVCLHNSVETVWNKLYSQLFLDLYFFRYNLGDQFKENNVLYVIDNSKREARYDSLQNFLVRFGKELSDVHEKTIEQNQKKYFTTDTVR